MLLCGGGGGGGRWVFWLLFTVAAITAMNYNEFWFDIGCDICWAKMPYHGTFVVAKGHDTFIVQKRAINYAFDQTWQDQYKDWK